VKRRKNPNRFSRIVSIGTGANRAWLTVAHETEERALSSKAKAFVLGIGSGYSVITFLVWVERGGIEDALEIAQEEWPDFYDDFNEIALAERATRVTYGKRIPHTNSYVLRDGSVVRVHV
jgi:hypothetical protein